MQTTLNEMHPRRMHSHAIIHARKKMIKWMKKLWPYSCISAWHSQVIRKQALYITRHTCLSIKIVNCEISSISFALINFNCWHLPFRLAVRCCYCHNHISFWGDLLIEMKSFVFSPLSLRSDSPLNLQITIDDYLLWADSSDDNTNRKNAVIIDLVVWRSIDLPMHEILIFWIDGGDCPHVRNRI